MSSAIRVIGWGYKNANLKFDDFQNQKSCTIKLNQHPQEIWGKHLSRIFQK